MSTITDSLATPIAIYVVTADVFMDLLRFINSIYIYIYRNYTTNALCRNQSAMR